MNKGPFKYYIGHFSPIHDSPSLLCLHNIWMNHAKNMVFLGRGENSTATTIKKIWWSTDLCNIYWDISLNYNYRSFESYLCVYVTLELWHSPKVVLLLQWCWAIYQKLYWLLLLHWRPTGIVPFTKQCIVVVTFEVCH